MNFRKLFGFILMSVVMVIMAACAKVSAPTGGLRDRKPPVVVKSMPENGAKNFHGKSISVTFDEYVVLDNINEKFMVSPPMKKKPRVFIKGKSVNVEYEDQLKDSTTYTFYFLDAIRDLNENNPLYNFQFVFSTGPVIDSLSVTGNVYNATNLEVPEKTQVIMFSSMEDSAVIKNLPDYITRVDVNGYFRIDNVKGGKYRLYSLKDDDNSKNYNRMEEEFAFMDSPIMVTSEKSFIPFEKDTSIVKQLTLKANAPVQTLAKPPPPPALTGEHQLSLFLANKRDHYLTGSARDSKYLLTYTLSVPPDSMKVEFSIPDIDRSKYLIEESRRGDTIKVWLTDSTLYSQSTISTIISYPFTDTLKVVGYKTDTIPMRFITPRATRGTKTTKTGLKVDNNITGATIKPGVPIIFKTETPFRLPDTTRIKFYELTEANKQRVDYRFEMDSTNSGKLIMRAKLIQGKKYLLIADSAAFGNIFNENNDSTGFRFSIKNPDTYGKLILNIQNCQGPLIIQLLNNSEKIMGVKRTSKDGKVEFPLLDNGFYRIRVIYDLNDDGEWTTGDFMTGRQPEPVSYYKSEVEVKPGWEANQDFDVKVRNFKEQKLRVKPK